MASRVENGGQVPQAELQAKYDRLKTKQRILEEQLRSADKRSTQFEEEVKEKNEQLEELYNQVDSMQDCISTLEKESSEKQGQVSKL